MNLSIPSLLFAAAMTWAADLDAAFARTADAALAAMQTTAESLKIEGAAVVACLPMGSDPAQGVQGWTSRMKVVGKFIKGNSNVLGIVYSKMAEMADTLQDSGSKIRPPHIGENGYQGGLIAKVPGGYLIAAFSGGWDQRISRVGLDLLVAAAQAPAAQP